MQAGQGCGWEAGRQPPPPLCRNPAPVISHLAARGAVHAAHAGGGRERVIAEVDAWDQHMGPALQKGPAMHHRERPGQPLGAGTGAGLHRMRRED